MYLHGFIKAAAVAAAGLMLMQAPQAAEIKGFRKALFGASEQSVMAAIMDDFQVSKEAVRASTEPSTGMRVLEVTVPDFEPLKFPAKLNYVLGYKCQCLVQVGVRWELPESMPSERRIETFAAVEALQKHLSDQPWTGDQVVSNRALGEAKAGQAVRFLFFRGVNERNSSVVMLGEPVTITADQNNPSNLGADFNGMRAVQIVYEFDSSKQDVRRFKINGF